MQAQNWTPLNGVDELRCACHLRAKFDDRARIAVFGSFLGGYHVLRELLEQLEQEMYAYAAEYAFEKAEKVRVMIEKIRV